VLGIVAVLLALAAVVGPPFLQRSPFLADALLPWWAVAVAFAVTETFVLHVPTRRETQTISFGELPLVLGLFFAEHRLVAEHRFRVD
jgi:hypothetical protein